jgi:hypothetical protein
MHIFTLNTLSPVYKKVVGILCMTLLLLPTFFYSIQPTVVHADAVEGLGLDNDNANYAAEDFGCFSSKAETDSLIGCVSYGAYLFMTLVAKLAAAVGVLLNYAVMELVVGMGLLVGNIPGVVIAWQALRDLVTVFLVFLTIFIGLATILGVSRFGYKQLLMKVILAALFVNFSITIAKVVIDLANITAMESYSMLLKQSPLDLSTCTNALTNIELAHGTNNVCLDNGIATIFWSKLKIMTIMNVDPNELANQQSAMLVTFVMGSLMFIVLAYVIGAGAFLLVGRFVALIYLIIVSPIGLVAWITGISGNGKKWWTTLIDQAVLAPFLFLSWWVVLMVTDGLGNRYNVEGFGPESFTSVGGLAVFVHFVIIIALLIISLRTAKSLGGEAAKKSMNAYDSARGKLGAILATGAGAAAVYTGGAASARLADRYRNARARAEEFELDADGNRVYKDTSNRAAIMRGVGKSQILDRNIQRAIEAPSKKGVLGVKSYTARTEEVQKLQQARTTELKAALPRAKLDDAITIINDSTSPTKSFNQDKYNEAVRTLQGAKADDLAYIKNKMKAGTLADFGNGGATKFDAPEIQELLTKKQATELGKRSETTFAEKQQYGAIANKDINAVLKSKKELEQAEAKLGTNANVDSRAAFEKQKQDFEDQKRKAMASVSDDDVVDNLSTYRKNPELLSQISPEQHGRIIKKLHEVGNYADADTLTKGRYADTNTLLTQIDAEQDATKKQALVDEFKNNIRKLDTTDVEQLNKEVKEHELFGGSLSQSQFENFTKTKRGSLMPSQVEKLKQDRTKYFEQALDDGSMKGELEKMTPKQISSLDKKILQDDRMLQYLDSHTIKLMTTSEDGREARKIIKDKVASQYVAIEEKLQEARRLVLENERKRVASLSESDRQKELMSGKKAKVPSEDELTRNLTDSEKKIRELHSFFSSNTNAPRV